MIIFENDLGIGIFESMEQAKRLLTAPFGDESMSEITGMNEVVLSIDGEPAFTFTPDEPRGIKHVLKELADVADYIRKECNWRGAWAEPYAKKKLDEAEALIEEARALLG
jgi:hypothetical protein